MKVKELIKENVDNIDGQLIGNLMTEIMNDAVALLEQRIASNIGAIVLEDIEGISDNEELLDTELDEEICNKINNNIQRNIEAMFKMSTFFALTPKKSFTGSIQLLSNIIDEQITIKKIGLANDEETLVMIYNMRDVINFKELFKDDIERVELNDIEQLILLADSLAITQNHKAIIDKNDYSELYDNITKTINAYEKVKTIRTIMEVMSSGE